MLTPDRPPLPELEDLAARVLGVARSKIGPDAGPKTLREWNSLRHVALITAVEEAYGVEFTISDVIEINSLADLRAGLRAKGRAV